MASSHSSRHDHGSPSKLNPAPPLRLRYRSRPIKQKSVMALLSSWIVHHQIGTSLNLLILLALVHLTFPPARPTTSKFFTMAYYDPLHAQYRRGPDDLYFVACCIVGFIGLRAAVMDYALRPLGRRWGRIASPKILARFAEQGWLLCYATCFWSMGMYIAYASPYWLNLRELWAGFPVLRLDGLTKAYYLVQFAFWLQQLFSVHIEERRSDHWQMVVHHLFTASLLFFSYGFYQTRVGNAILCIMDVIEIIFPIAKMLKYVGLSTACDVAFGVFLVAWFFARHLAYLAVCYSIVAPSFLPQVWSYGCFDSVTGNRLAHEPSTKSCHSAQSDWQHGGSQIVSNVLQSFVNPGGMVCFNKNIRNAFLFLLLGLQTLTLIWFGMILRVAWRVITGNGAEDIRSDDEGDESGEDLDQAEDNSNENPQHYQYYQYDQEKGIMIPKEQNYQFNQDKLYKYSDHDDNDYHHHHHRKNDSANDEHENTHYRQTPSPTSADPVNRAKAPKSAVTHSQAFSTFPLHSFRRHHSQKSSSGGSTAILSTASATTLPPKATAATTTQRVSSRTCRTAKTSALSIPGYGDHKELLGRIGCDKPV